MCLSGKYSNALPDANSAKVKLLMFAGRVKRKNMRKGQGGGGDEEEDED